MTNKEQIAEMVNEVKSGKTRTYADAIEALAEFENSIKYRQNRIDKRYAEGKGDTAMTKMMERDQAKACYAYEQMELFVSVLFDVNEHEVYEDAK